VTKKYVKLEVKFSVEEEKAETEKERVLSSLPQGSNYSITTIRNKSVV
jgi:hypothetical protein